jgi:glutamyl-Q tRNA(Asp) synthetase
MEDLDTPRCVLGAADDILRTLEAFGLHNDEPVLYQSQRTSAYEKALQQLQASGVAYPCCCTRKEIADSALNGVEGPVYPGTCRQGIPAGREGRAWRVRTDCTLHPQQGGGRVQFDDTLQGRISQHLEPEIGDFVVKRADGFFAYQLAVVVDDAFQHITHIVRGADLLDSTPRQIYLQHLLGLPVSNYMHLPVAVNGSGEKLSKQTLAAPVDESHPVRTLLRVLDFLRQHPPVELAGYDAKAVLDWAIEHWDTSNLRGINTLPAS